ncbi:MAG TPA: hypothetical protein VGR69_10570 [Candidatus Rubrimentiphilum sp.]|nr:hypothetical protein [Candidatus Rubrimentiphilum sp.]
MEQYLIGSGAILESGETARLTPAALHARVDPALAECVGAAAIDFEGQSLESLRRLVVIVAGWNGQRFRSEVSDTLLRRGSCSLGDVLQTLAQAVRASQVHLFSRWLPDDATYAQLQAHGVEIVAHPLEAIESAAVVAGQRHTRWTAVRAA